MILPVPVVIPSINPREASLTFCLGAPNQQFYPNHLRRAHDPSLYIYSLDPLFHFIFVIVKYRAFCDLYLQYLFRIISNVKQPTDCDLPFGLEI